jgi:hypothetical protein
MADALFSEEVVATLPAGCVPAGMTADGHLYALWRQPDGRVRFVWDGTPGEPFDGVVALRDKAWQFWSADGCHLAYIGQRSGRKFVGRDAGEDPAWDDVSGSVRPTWSADGGHLAYGVTAVGDHWLVLDGAITGSGSLAPIACAFSADGRRLAYAEIRGAERMPEYRIVVDGVPGDWFIGMRNAPNVMQFSPDGRRFAYFRTDGKGHGQWVVDAVAQRWINDGQSLGLAQLRGVAVLDPALPASFSPDSARFAYWADVVEKGVTIIEDDQPGPLLKACGTPCFGGGGRRLAYSAQTFRNEAVLVVDGVVGPGWSGNPSEPVFSPDGSRVAVTVEREEGGLLGRHRTQVLAVDGTILLEERGRDASRWPVFSPDGRHLAWWVEVSDAECRMYLDATAEPGYVLSDGRFGATGSLVYVAALPGGQTIMRDGRPGLTADVVLSSVAATPAGERPGAPQFRLSLDGAHVAWAGMFGEGKPVGTEARRREGPWPRPVLDDLVGPTYDHLLSWNVDGATPVWWAMRGNDLLRVTARG